MDFLQGLFHVACRQRSRSRKRREVTLPQGVIGRRSCEPNQEYSNYGCQLRLQPLAFESPQGLKRLRDGATETVETLLSLGRPASSVDDFLVHLTIQRCDPVTRRDWELSLGKSTELLNWPQLDDFLVSRIQGLERAEPKGTPPPDEPAPSRTVARGDKKTSSNPRKVNVHTASHSKTSSRPGCSFCQAAHFVAACDKFRSRSVDDRCNFVSEKQLCYNCLGPHRLAECQSKKSCFICRGRHHTLIHRDQPSQQSIAAPKSSTHPPNERSSREVASHATKTDVAQSRSILLATARLILSSDNNRSASVRALIDPCSEASFITECLAQRLRLPRQSVSVPVSGVGAALCHTARSATHATISPRFESGRSWRIKALILPRLTNYLPPPQRIKSSLTFTEGIRLADPNHDSLDSIEMILGADVFPRIIEEGLRKSPDEDTLTQATGLGWILTGSALSSPSTFQSSTAVSSLQCLVDGDLSPLLERFWTQEEATVQTDRPLTNEEAECENHFASTQKRTSEGKYVLKLPFKSNLSLLGNSEPAARSMLKRMEKSFADQPQLREKYVQFMDEYAATGHMREVSVEDDPPSRALPTFYLPHHGVFKTNGDTSKLRVVFNGSVKLRNGLNLNDCLHTGPKLQADIFDVLLRWRVHRYVFSADIKQMFRQIRVDPDDQRYQRILWRDSPQGPIRTFQLCTVTYGLASSPYQAIRTLRQLALDEGHRFPQAAQLLCNNSYVDDILAGADTIEEANCLKVELVELLMAGGFPLSKWTANHPSILSSVPEDQLAASQQRIWQQSEALTMLGISWQPSTDEFHFHFSAPQASEVITKRKALSLIAQLYDPLGWIVPITVSFKIFMQTLWHTGLNWDETLPSALLAKWNHLFVQLQQLQNFSIPRWAGLSTHHRRVELHGFSDASERAYAACLYVRTIDDQGNVNSTLLASKSKVASLKQVSLPRLELSGALLLVRLTKRIQNVIHLDDVACHLWSDSTVTLSWIREHPSVWKTYVANRVSEIQTTLPQACWHYVAGKENPADCASRGVSPRELANSTLWLSGPSFLRSGDATWTSATDHPLPKDCPERRGPSCLVINRPPSESEVLLRFSCITRLLRITTRCFEFVQKLRTSSKRLAGANAGELSRLDPVQLESTLKFWVKHVQTSYFSTEIQFLSQAKSLSSKSPLIRLNPFLDDFGLLRVGGRLRHSLLHPDEMHPISLPRESHLSQLVVRNTHAKTLHGGTQLTLSYVRQRFWIVRGRQLVKSVILKCVRCWRQRAAPAMQLMGDLPSRRVQRYRPFLHTGIDYAGPINLRLSKGRGTRSYKGYIAVFVCLATRAVHLEAASGYSTADFLNVYRRFVARRGICASISSDCGTNFVGAEKELRSLFAQAGAQSTEIAHLLANDGTEWKFNPPAAPHFGGIWEAAAQWSKSRNLVTFCYNF
ncbi:uncharacterized protein LOC143217409 [Lasioglossum baleicum]|uniref:uncharacterized protein LOC143217409 n=1 Tax=Lasioglossum baleicum TaxID=434251 RepID=UPI003FCE23E3